MGDTVVAYLFLPIMAVNAVYVVGELALKEIRRYQKSTENQIPTLPFQRLVKEVLQRVGMRDLKIQVAAVSALRVLYLFH